MCVCCVCVDHSSIWPGVSGTGAKRASLGWAGRPTSRSLTQETRGEGEGYGGLGVQWTKAKGILCSWASILFYPKEVVNTTEHIQAALRLTWVAHAGGLHGAWSLMGSLEPGRVWVA